jgi:anti-anti-sigma regulatory factor
MRRRLLIITKDPEFDMRGEVVLGQCEPFTSGWQLILIETGGRRETLMVGAYSDLRKIQESCGGIDETEKLRKRVGDMRILLTSNVTETVRIPISAPNSAVDTNDVTKEMPPITPDMLPRLSPGGLLNLTPTNGIVIATVLLPDRADDTNFLRNELMAVLSSHPRAVLMDLKSVPRLSPGSVKELAGLRDLLRENGADFALCNVPTDMRDRLRDLRPKETLPVFETQESALAALRS